VSETAPVQTTPAGPSGRPAALGFIYTAILMNTISMGLIIPVFPTLVKSLTGQGDAGAAQIMGIFGAVWALMRLTFAPIFGNLSDRFGRRPVLLVSMFGLSFDYLLMAMAPSIAWLFVGRVIAGITASSDSAAGAYVADVSTPENRARNFGRFQAAANAGILLGPALGGFVGVLDPRAPFWIASALAFANGLYGFFVVPESLSHDRRAPFHWKRANPVGAAALLIGRKGLLGMALILFVMQFAGSSFNSIFQFYTHYRYGWGPPQIALLLMVLGGGNIVIQSLGAGWAARRIGERGAVIAGMMLGSVGFAVVGLGVDGLRLLGRDRHLDRLQHQLPQPDVAALQARERRPARPTARRVADTLRTQPADRPDRLLEPLRLVGQRERLAYAGPLDAGRRGLDRAGRRPCRRLCPAAGSTPGVRAGLTPCLRLEIPQQLPR
jgi:DHA1 family tetracycline resistance protein-like MFS transporter